MARDIDHIITEVQKHCPTVQVVQMPQFTAADDNGLWWFRILGHDKDIQIESPTGHAPFLVETDDDASSEGARVATSPRDSVAMIASYLSGLARPGS